MIDTINCIFFAITFSTIYFYSKNDISTYFISKYNKWLSLNNLVSSKYNSKIMIEIISIKMFLKSLYLSFIQYMNNSLIKIDKNSYQLSYIVNGKLYKMVIKPTRGPVPILCVINENNLDITDEIIPYLGPNNDWHGKKYCPNFFNYNTLNIELLNGDKKIFNKNDIIVI
jgi:hypothetical protein